MQVGSALTCSITRSIKSTACACTSIFFFAMDIPLPNVVLMDAALAVR